MSVIRYPVLVWPDAAGRFTAALVGDLDQAAACAGTARDAMNQLKELLAWRMEREAWNVDPDLTQPQLLEVKVEVRPEYSEEGRVMPCPETIWLRVPCVTGVQESALNLCVVPHLGLRFNFQEAATLKSLVAHYVKEALRGRTPLQLARDLPPQGCKLEEIVLADSTGRERWVHPSERREYRVLFEVADPLLHDVGRKRTASAAYGRDDLCSLVARKLAQESGNVLLVGEAGVGKSTILLAAAKKLRRELPAKADREKEETRDLDSYRFWRGNAGRLIAGMQFLGEWEERCEEFIARLGLIEGVFCAENLLELLQAGGMGPGASVGAFLLPFLERRELRLVSEATPAELEACRRLLPGLLDVLEVIQVPAFSDEQAVEVLRRVADAYAGSNRLDVETGVAPLIHRLFKRFIPYANFPGPAAGFLRALCNRATKRSSASVTMSDVIAQFVEQTGLPELFLRDDLLLQMDDVRAGFAAEIIGQPEATAAAARLITTIKAGLTDPARPFGVLLFCGPTGVGKTALAKSIAGFCFGAGGQKDRLVRLDMSEYSGAGAAQRLLRAAHDQPASWIEKVRRQPFCVLLFDEIEKAAPEVFDVLLGVLDEGRLTDQFGRVTDFRSAIIVMTSNLGADAPAEVGFAGESGSLYESEVSKFFRPEFFNRLDAVITFRALSAADVEAIARKEIEELAQREGFVSAGIRISVSEPVVALLVREGYDHRYGARPLQRALERLAVKPLARWRVAHPNSRDAALELILKPDGQVEVRQNPAGKAGRS